MHSPFSSTFSTVGTIQSATSSWISSGKILMQRTLQFARVFNSHKTVALRIYHFALIWQSRGSPFMQIVSANTIYIRSIRSILLSSRIELAFAYMIKYLRVPAVAAGQRETDREREGEQEKVRKNVYCLSWPEKEKEWGVDCLLSIRAKASSMPTRTTTSTPVRMQFKVQGRNQGGGHHERGTVARSSRDKQSRQRVREGKEEGKAKAAQEDDENLTAFFVKTFACLQIWWCPAAPPSSPLLTSPPFA